MELSCTAANAAICWVNRVAVRQFQESAASPERDDVLTRLIAGIAL
jgi:hypothetical protein